MYLFIFVLQYEKFSLTSNTMLIALNYLEIYRSLTQKINFWIFNIFTYLIYTQDFFFPPKNDKIILWFHYSYLNGHIQQISHRPESVNHVYRHEIIPYRKDVHLTSFISSYITYAFFEIAQEF